MPLGWEVGWGSAQTFGPFLPKGGAASLHAQPLSPFAVGRKGVKAPREGRSCPEALASGPTTLLPLQKPPC